MKRFSACAASLLIAAGSFGCIPETGELENLEERSDELKGGTVVTTDTWGSPFSSSWVCSSTLLRDRWLMTAKHCNPGGPVIVGLTNGMTAQTQTIIDHPTLDVSLIRLSAALTPSGTASTRGPYPLYRGSESKLLSKEVYCQGTGAYSCDGGTCTGLGTLNSAKTTVVTVNTGLAPYCGGDPGCFRTQPQRSNGGDSGGGCMLKVTLDRNRVVGVISGGNGTEDFHASVPRFRDWANGIIGSAPTFGALTGYERADLYNAVVYVNPSNHLIELSAETGGWSRGDLTDIMQDVNASSDPTAFVTWDGYASIAFRSAGDDHIRELTLQHGGGWTKRDITGPIGAPAAAGNPASYGRSDRYGIVLYRSTDNRVIELSRFDGTNNWGWAALSTALSAPLAASDPVGYVRADGSNGVVYRSADNHIWELRLTPGLAWSSPVDLMAAPISAPNAIGQPRPYTRSDGVTAIVYRNADNSHIMEIALPSGTVTDLNISSGAVNTPVTDPVGYVRADGKSVVIFKASDNKIRELTWTGSGWTKANLTTDTPNAPDATGTGLSAFVTATRVSVVLYRTLDNHVRILQRPLSASAWTPLDLTEQVGGSI